MPTPTNAQLTLKPGDRVVVTLDDGSTREDVVKNAPTKLGGHTWVAWLENTPGSYLLTRVRPVLR